MIIEADGGKLSELTDSGFCIADFYSESCAPCKMLAPVLNRLESLLPFIKIIKVNVTAHPEYVEENDINAFPTLKFYNEGKLCETFVGFKSLEQLEATVGKYMYG